MQIFLLCKCNRWTQGIPYSTVKSTLNVWILKASSFPLVYAEYWTRIRFQTICDKSCLQKPPFQIGFSVSTGKIYTFSSECENGLAVSDCAPTSFDTVTLNIQLEE